MYYKSDHTLKVLQHDYVMKLNNEESSKLERKRQQLIRGNKTMYDHV
jgi:hypothetical protein